MSPEQIVLLIFTVSVFAVTTAALYSVLKSNKEFKKCDVLFKLKQTSKTHVHALCLLGICIILMPVLSLEFLTCVLLALPVAVICGYLVFISQMRFGVTEKGVYLPGRFLAFSSVQDYLINTEKCTVIFSKHYKGGLSTSGITPPLKYGKEDEKLIIEFFDGLIAEREHKITVR